MHFRVLAQVLRPSATRFGSKVSGSKEGLWFRDLDLTV